MLSLALANNGLSGTFPWWPTPFLPNLRLLDLGDNQLEGSLPPLISSPLMETLVWSNNNFSGFIQGDGQFQFDNLRYVAVHDNQLQGGYQGVIFPNTPLLEVWDIGNNQFSGSIGTDIGLVRNLIHFRDYNSYLTGTIETEFGLLLDLQELDLSDNPALHGVVPSQLGNLSHLTHLNVGGTSLVGSIPASLCTRMEEGLLEVKVNCSRVQCC